MASTIRSAPQYQSILSTLTRIVLTGPIIRINPTEIHISDPNFYDLAYSISKPLDKLPHLRDRFGLPDAMFSTAEHEIHRRRRMAASPYFSRRAVNNFAPFIQQRAERMCARLISEYKGSSKVVIMNEAWAAYTTDIIMFYAFAWSYDCIDCPDFIAPFTHSIKMLVETAHLGAHFPLMMKLLRCLPDAVVGTIYPVMKSILRFQNVRDVEDISFTHA